MAKHLIFADGHLADRAWVKREVVGDSYFALDQILKIQFEHDCKSVTSAGDLVDQTRNFSAPIANLGQFIAQLNARDCPFYFIQGQHDLADPPWPSQFEGAYYVNKATFKLGEMTAYGLDYLHADELEGALADIPKKASILIGHQAWEECKAERAPAQASVKTIPEHVTMLFTGDYHVTLRKKVKRADKDAIRVFSPGSTCLQSINEPLEKNVFILDDETGEVTTVPLITRPVVVSEPMHDEQSVIDFLDMLEALVNKKRDAAKIDDPLVAMPLVIAKIGKNAGKVDKDIRKLCKKLDVHCIINAIKPKIVPAVAVDDEDDEEEATPANVLDFLKQSMATVFTEDEKEESKLCEQLIVAERTEEGTRNVLNSFWSGK
jgi:hypothetical protein